MNGRTRPVPIDWKTTVEMSSLPSRGRSCQNEESRGRAGTGLVELTGAVCRAPPTAVVRFRGPTRLRCPRVRGDSSSWTRQRPPPPWARWGPSSLAEDGGFEPPRVLSQHDFQSCALGHYANPPSRRLPEAHPTQEIGVHDAPGRS